MVKDEVVIACRPELDELDRLRDAFLRYAVDHGMDGDAVSAVRLALEETAVNVLNHGFDADPEPFFVRWSIEGDTLCVELEDSGKPFNPLEHKAPDVSQDLEARPIGGLGIYLVRHLMDHLDYRRENGHNILSMKKRVLHEAHSPWK